MSSREESSVLDFLDQVIEETPEVTRAARRERLRLELARFMKKARDTAGMTQHDVAEALGVTQGWVSKLESANHDHKLESILSYFDALGGEMNLSASVRDSTFQIWGSSPTSSWAEMFASPEIEALLASFVQADFITEGIWDWPIQEEEHTHSRAVIDLQDYRQAQTTYFGLSGRVLQEANAT